MFHSNFRFNIAKAHLETLCNTFGVEFIEVNAAYSSMIGNFVHSSATCPDMVAASIEIARRAYKKFEKTGSIQEQSLLEDIKRFWETNGRKNQNQLICLGKAWQEKSKNRN